MKKINFKGISEVLSEKELKNVMGGSGTNCQSTDCGRPYACTNSNGMTGTCKAAPFAGCICWAG